MSREADERGEFFVLVAALCAVALPGFYVIDAAGTQIGVWYAAAATAWFAPPFWLGGLGWIATAIAIAVAGWLGWREAGWPALRGPLAFSVCQIVLLPAWAWPMLVLHRTGWALPAAAALFVALGAGAVVLRRISLPAALLLAGAFVWVGYAGLVNVAIWRL